MIVKHSKNPRKPSRKTENGLQTFDQAYFSVYLFTFYAGRTKIYADTLVRNFSESLFTLNVGRAKKR